MLVVGGEGGVRHDADAGPYISRLHAYAAANRDRHRARPSRPRPSRGVSPAGPQRGPLGAGAGTSHDLVPPKPKPSQANWPLSPSLSHRLASSSQALERHAR